MIYFFLFAAGAIIGSFLNVCIYRLPRGQSIVTPASHCPACKSPVKWFDNVPLVSFLLLRGKCRSCGQPIAARYFIVELLAALSGPVVMLAGALDPIRFLMLWVMTLAFIPVTFIDLEYKLVPDIITLPGVFVGMIGAAFMWDQGLVFNAAGLKGSFLGAAAGGAAMIVMSLVGETLFKEKAQKVGGALGGGDVKLMAMIGAFLGLKMVLFTFFLAPVIGSIAGIYALIKRKDSVIPYAPYLVAAALLSLFFAERVMSFIIPSI